MMQVFLDLPCHWIGGRPITTVATATAGGGGNAFMTGVATRTIGAGRVMVISAGISRPLACSMTACTIRPQRHARVTLGTIIIGEGLRIMVIGAGINDPVCRGMAALTTLYHRQVNVTLLAVASCSRQLVMERLRFTRMARLAIVIFTRQATFMTIGTSQTSTFYANHIMVLSFG
jgi:hypothetical protein